MNETSQHHDGRRPLVGPPAGLAGGDPASALAPRTGAGGDDRDPGPGVPASGARGRCAPSPFRPPRRGRGWTLVAALLLLVGCSEDSSTDPAGGPVSLVALSAPVDTVVVGERLDPPVSVRVESLVGEPIEGIPVRFLLTRGSAEVEAMAVSNRQGIAESDFEAGSEPGNAGVRVDVPSATDVAPLEFEIVMEPAGRVALSVTGGDGQEAEIGSQLPLPFALRATTPSGAPAARVRIAWEGTGAGTLTADTTFTDGNGRAETLLTLGGSPGPQVVRAHAAGGVESDTVRFTATARRELSGSVRLDSIRPLPLEPGAQATVFGSGFGAAAAENEVRVEGEVARIVAGESGRIDFLVPSFGDRCLPARTVGVRVLVRGEPGNGELVGLRPARPALDLAPGEAATLRGLEAVSCVQIDSATASRAYRLAVQSGSRSPGATAKARLVVRAGSGPTAGRRGAAAAPGLEALDPVELQPTPELRLRASARGELIRRNVRPARLPRPASDSAARGSRVAATAPPSVGDTLSLAFAVQADLSASCADTAASIRGVVRAAGPDVVLVEDASAPEGGFTAADWAEIVSVVNGVTFPTDTAYFGSPADLDGNGRVVFLFTPEVNRLTPRGSQVSLGGFFLPLDLAAASEEGDGVRGPQGEICPVSNQGEILYLAAADPEGTVGGAVTVPQAKRNALGLGAHELQHLINAQQRVLHGDGGFEGLEESWLDEGLSQIAEEVVGFQALGMRERGNLSFEPFAASRATLDGFNTYHISNFFHLSLYMLDPGSAPTLAVQDPGGVGGLQMRGFAWAFLRWLADQDRGNERSLFRALSGGGRNGLRGTENIERAGGADWGDLLAEFSAALAVDDAGIAGLPDRLQLRTWHLRDVFSALSRNPSSMSRFPLAFPLRVTPLSFRDEVTELDLRASATRYLSLEAPTGSPTLSLRLESRGGASLPEGAAPQITIVRTR